MPAKEGQPLKGADTDRQWATETHYSQDPLRRTTESISKMSVSREQFHPPLVKARPWDVDSL